MKKNPTSPNGWRPDSGENKLWDEELSCRNSLPLT